MLENQVQDYKTALDTTINTKVALLSVGDIRLNNSLDNYFTLTGTKNKGTMIYSVNSNQKLYTKNIQSIVDECDVEVGDVLEISYNRIFAPGEVLGFTEEDEMTGEGYRVGLQLNGKILNQSVEIDFNEIADELIEMRHITDEKELVIEIL